jgi:phage tail-like protein
MALQPSPSASVPYFGAFRFQVWFTRDAALTATPTALSDAGFSEVSGLEANVEVKAYAEGGRAEGARQLVGRTTYPNLVLKRGMSRNLETWRWFSDVARGVRPVPRKGVIVELLDVGDVSRVVARWTVSSAVPVKMKLGDLNAKTGEIAIEELHLAHEHLELDFSLEGGTAGGL